MSDNIPEKFSKHPRVKNHDDPQLDHLNMIIPNIAVTNDMTGMLPANPQMLPALLFYKGMHDMSDDAADGISGK